MRGRWEAFMRVLVTGQAGYFRSLLVPFLQAVDLEGVGLVDA